MISTKDYIDGMMPYLPPETKVMVVRSVEKMTWSDGRRASVRGVRMTIFTPDVMAGASALNLDDAAFAAVRKFKDDYFQWRDLQDRKDVMSSYLKDRKVKRA